MGAESRRNVYRSSRIDRAHARCDVTGFCEEQANGIHVGAMNAARPVAMERGIAAKRPWHRCVGASARCSDNAAAAQCSRSTVQSQRSGSANRNGPLRRCARNPRCQAVATKTLCRIPSTADRYGIGGSGAKQRDSATEFSITKTDIKIGSIPATTADESGSQPKANKVYARSMP